MLHFEDFKAKSMAPLSVELGKLFLFKEGWCDKLFTPEWLVHPFGSAPQFLNIVVLDNILVVSSHVKGPNVFFIKCMINGRLV
jgi:hypothetical protein